ncbi:MAG: efflux RND transporter periplasmic adaptor subunit [Candidatus Omnitrophica bacterium]|nr:efflux RND transporter periplasmic adaptor subunit [Candidatus Omnitrophota bacterium]
MKFFKTQFFQKHKRLIIISIVLVGALIMWGWTHMPKKGGAKMTLQNIFKGKGAQKEGEAPLEAAIPVKTTKVVKTDYQDFVTSFGTIKGLKEIPVKFDEAARISRFYFKEGDSIKKGDLVVSQEQDEQKFKLEYVEIEYNKNKTLRDLGAITNDKLREAELELETAKASLNKKNFYAPSDGFIGTQKINEGELASPTDVVTIFVDIDNVFCEVGIIEKDMDKVKTGQTAKIMIEAFPDDVFEGTVDSVSPMLEGRSRTQTVKMLVPNEKGTIKPGMFAKADIMIFEKKDAIVIPRKALQKSEDGYAVFGVVRPEGEAKKSPAGFEEATAKVMPVKVERANEENALISEGLEDGQEIVLETPEAKSSIKDGATIEILPNTGNE